MPEQPHPWLSASRRATSLLGKHSRRNIILERACSPTDARYGRAAPEEMPGHSPTRHAESAVFLLLEHKPFRCFGMSRDN